MPDEQFLTTDEVLGYLKIKERTLYRLIKSHQLPAVRVGRQWRFRQRDIDRWLARNRPRADGTEQARPRVLVVDDDATVRDVISRALEEAYEVETAPDGPTALQQLRSSTFDLLVTDLLMPGMDGLSVIREVRTSSEIPVVIITGNSTEACAIEAINLGVSGYLMKPFRLPRIRQAVARALGEPPREPGS